MDLVVQELSLLFRSLLVGELSAANSIAGRYHGRSEHVEGASHGDCKSSQAHDLVKQAWVRFQLKLAIFHNLCKSAQHGISRNFQVLDQEIAIINAVISELRADVTDFDAWERLMCI